MKQAFEFSAHSKLRFCFDFVFDAVVPKQAKSRHQPHYTHVNGFYFARSKSCFDRSRSSRDDVYDSKYWPTIFRAPRDTSEKHALAKNVNALTNLLRSFETQSLCDPFAGSGSSAIAAHACGLLQCTMIESEAIHCLNPLELENMLF